jgi:hypothetical protein
VLHGLTNEVIQDIVKEKLRVSSPLASEDVVKGLVEKVSPQEKNILAEKGLMVNKISKIYPDAIREVGQSLRGRTKLVRTL